MSWLGLFLIVIVVCFTVDNMFANYLNKKYPKHRCPICDRTLEEEQDDDPEG
jgi:hypothetical protein